MQGVLLVHAVTGMLQLLALLLFGAGVYRINQLAPRRVALRAFKLEWLLGSAAAGLCLAFVLARVVNLPARIQTTPLPLVQAHDDIRSTCQRQVSAALYDAAYATISTRTKTAELVGASMQHAVQGVKKTSLARMMQPLLNSLLFHTGVTVAFLPALARLLLLLWRIRSRRASGRPEDAKFNEHVRREWGVLLPVMNAVTVLSLCVSPYFYFRIEPNRAHRCIYSSGHFYTFTCTLLTFGVVLSHLYRNRDYCRTSRRMLVWYFAFFMAYVAMALTVLQTTQTFYHDDLEARDGMLQALPAFCLFVGVLIVFQFLTASSRDVGGVMPGKHVRTTSGGEVQTKRMRPSSASSSALAANMPAKARRLLGVDDEMEGEAEAATLTTDAKESEAKLQTTRAGSHKKGAREPSPAAPTGEGKPETELDRSDEEDAVLVSAADSQPSPPHAAAPAASSAAPEAPPLAPPLAPVAPAAPKPAVSSAPAKRRPIPAPERDPQAELLAGIKAGVQLRKTTRPDSTAARSTSLPAAPAGLMGALAARMAQVREAIDGEKAEEDEKDWQE